MVYLDDYNTTMTSTAERRAAAQQYMSEQGITEFPGRVGECDL